MIHCFDIELATKYGLLEAILLNNLWYWIEKNKANEVNFYDGTYWTYNSTKAFKELFPYASERQIQTALKKLKDEGIIRTGNYNQSAYDRTLWYAFTITGLSIMQKCKMENTNLLNRNVENVEPIPNNKPNNKPNNIKNKESRFIPPTLEEIEEYCKERNNGVNAKQFYDYYSVNDWKDNRGNQIKNWKQKMIANWENKVKKEDKPKKPYSEIVDGQLIWHYN